MKKIIILNLMLMLALHNFLTAQKPDSTSSISRVLMLQATICPGRMFYHGGMWNSYFNSTLEWCFDNRVSIRANGFYFFSTQGNYRPFKMNHSLMLGAFYHFPKRKLDYYFGVEPGAALVQQYAYKFNGDSIANPQVKVSPLITVSTGINYFFWKYMNIFAAIKFVHGTYIPPYGNSIPLDELRISAGIGWQVQFKRKGSNIRVGGFE